MSPNELLKIEHFKDIHFQIKEIVPDDLSGPQFKKVFKEIKLKSGKIAKLFDVSPRTVRNWFKEDKLSRLIVLATRSIIADKIHDKQTD